MKAAADELLQRAKQEVKGVENDQTRVIKKFEMPEDALPDFADEKPTKPGKHKAEEREAAPSIIPRAPGSEPPEPFDFESVRVDADMRAIPEVSGMVQKMDVVSSVPPGLGSGAPPLLIHDIAEFPPVVPVVAPRWPKIVLAVITPAAIIVTALAVMRYLGVPL